MSDVGDQAAQEELRQATRAAEAIMRMAVRRLRRDPRAKTVRQRSAGAAGLTEARVRHAGGDAEAVSRDQMRDVQAAAAARRPAVPEVAFAPGAEGNAVFTLATVPWDADCSLFRGQLDALLGEGGYAANLLSVAGEPDAWAFEVAGEHMPAVAELVDADIANVKGMSRDRFSFSDSAVAALGGRTQMPVSGRDEAPLDDVLVAEVDDEALVMLEEAFRESGFAYVAEYLPDGGARITVSAEAFADAEPRIRASLEGFRSMPASRLQAVYDKGLRAAAAARGPRPSGAPRTAARPSGAAAPAREVKRDAATSPSQDRKMFELAARERTASARARDKEMERSL